MDIFIKVEELFKSKNVMIIDEVLNKLVQSYSFYNFIESIDFDNQEIAQNICESEAIIISYCKEMFFIISFKKTLIILNQSSIKLLHSLIFSKVKLPIYFLEKSKDIFCNQIKIENLQFDYDNTFDDEIKAFNEMLSLRLHIKNQISQVWKTISSCISGYLIKQSYAKINKRQEMVFYFNYYNPTPEVFNENEYIILRTIGFGSSSTAKLIYHTQKEELFVLKIPISSVDERQKLLDREVNNYLQINYPLFPKYYGKVKDLNYIVIQFINGKSLKNIKTLNLKYDEKATIIFKILMMINYLHKNGFVYRDLKPDNIIIDQNKNPFLIDFDRMVKNSSRENIEGITNDFSSPFVSPEVNSGKISYSNDIYSIGQMICYIMNEKLTNDKATWNIDLNDYNILFYRVYEACTSEYDHFLCVESLMNFYYYFLSNMIELPLILHDDTVNRIRFNNNNIQYIDFILTHKNEKPNEYDQLIQNLSQKVEILKFAAERNSVDAQITLGALYLDGKYIKQDISLSIHYFSLAAEKNNPIAQYNLGDIYYNGEYITQNINKAISFYTKSAHQNYKEAQFKLGNIYSDDKNVTLDINKSIYYYTQAANQNCIEAQFNLGIIYYDGKLIKQDIDKSIHYLSLAADQNVPQAQYIIGCFYVNGMNVKKDITKGIKYLLMASKQNHPDAQLSLGFIYIERKCVERDIEKSLYYFTLAANQNILKAQFALGAIYFDNIFIKRDINKAIYFLELASNQNHREAQNVLGMIFYDNKYIKRDIAKSIYYYELAASQNHPKAQFTLGYIYHEGEYIARDINKSIFYFNCAAKNNFLEALYFLGVIYYENKYIPVDINKSIYYFTLAANRNHGESQELLARIYYENKYVIRDINKTIYYLTLASNQNIAEAQYTLGVIYSDNKYIKRDINNSLKYYNLAANQGYAQAHHNLGILYFCGDYIEPNIEKGINYLTFAANQNVPESQIALGNIYIRGEKIKKDINKGIYYLTLASNQNNKDAQYDLGYMYLSGFDVEKNINKGIDFIYKSLKNGKTESCFIMGYFFHEGKHVTRDIQKSIQYYRNASNQYAINNLGVIHKNGFNEIPKNIGLAMGYFEDAIKMYNDKISMYNLAHIYIYEDVTNDRLDKSIKLLVDSFNQNFIPSIKLLCIALIKKHGFNFNHIIEDIKKKVDKSSFLPSLISFLLFIPDDLFKKYDAEYQNIKTVDYLYNTLYKEIISKKLINEKETQQINDEYKNISSDFYEGFGI